MALAATLLPSLVLGLEIAGLQFTTSAGLDYGTMDSHLSDMSSFAKSRDWDLAEGAYQATDALSNLSIADLTVSLDGHPLGGDMTAAYWEGEDYAATFVTNALHGSGDFEGWDNTSRRELLTKGAAYQVVRQAVLGRLHEGVGQCIAGNSLSGVYLWEAAYALHAGHLEGSDGSGKGESMYALGDKRCPQFDTCVEGTRISINNALALSAWQRGIAALAAGDCFGALGEQYAIVSALTIPLVQGMLREAWEVDPEGGAALADGRVEVAEGWAFTAAILPQLALCNRTAGGYVYRNMYLNAEPPVADGFSFVKQTAESLYSCLGITCAQVGGMLLADQTPIPGMEPCTDLKAAKGADEDEDEYEDGTLPEDCSTTDESLTSALIVLTAVFGVASLALAVGLALAMKRLRDRTVKMPEVSLGGV